MHPLVDQLGLPDPGPLDHLALPDQPGLLAGRLAPRAQVSLDRLDRLVKPDQVALLGLVLVRRSHGPQHGHIFRLASRGDGPGQEARR